MLHTHGKNVRFDWFLVGDTLTIKNERGRIHKYQLDELVSIIEWLHDEFGTGWFPLANNVQKLGNGTEKPGLGVAILNQSPDDIEHAQGSSYLGVILDHCGVFNWNGKRRGIQWRIERYIDTKDQLRNLLAQ